jgi:transcriptional regulator with PAS, ATPase and Fis domain
MSPSKSRSDPPGASPARPFQRVRPINVLHLKEILDRVYFGSVVVDDKGILTFLSQPYADFLGVGRDAVIGRHVTEVIENTRMHIVVQIGEVEIGRQRIRGEDLVVQRVPIRDEAGRIVGAFGQVMFKVEELHDLMRRLNLLESRVAYYEQELHSLRASRYTFHDIVGESPALEEAKRLALRAARSMSPVLLVGETGVGKELFTHAIHHASPRSRRPLVRVNCAAIPRDLVEAELFGYEPGAFTGASKRGKPGKFELADGGSLFLDEIADMKLDVQANVLRVLQEKEVERIGGTDPIKVDFRLLAATHEDLEALVAEGRFRADLFYRLNVVPIRIPPLRERREDIPALVSHILCHLSEDMGRPPVRVTPAAMSALQGHDWPGNVRELVNVLERILNALDGDVIDVTHLPFVSSKPASAVRDADVGRLRRLLREHEDLAVQQALTLARGNKAEAARLLGIHRASLYRKLSRGS